MQITVVRPYRRSFWRGYRLPDAPVFEAHIQHRGSGHRFPVMAFVDSGCDRTCISARRLAFIERQIGAIDTLRHGTLPFDVVVVEQDQPFLLRADPGIFVAPADRFADEEDLLLGRDILNRRRVELDGLGSASGQPLGLLSFHVYDQEKLDTD